jgi:NAD-dependent deacetylase
MAYRKKLVVLTGAGMSAESGISTFRDSGGLWEQHRVEDVATPEGWMANPVLVHQFYNERRKQLIEAKPNLGHYALAELEQDFDVHVITQNVDDLHERAGSLKVLHLHGELMKMRSTGPGEEVFDVDPAKPEYGLEDKCPKGYPLRPHIVWFGEMVPEYENAASVASKADILLIIGTSMQVYPAAGLLHYVQPTVPVYLIDPQDVKIAYRDVYHIKKGASEGMEEFKRLMREQ